MEDYIWTVDNCISDAVCENLRAFIDRYEGFANRVQYGAGENTDCQNLQIGELFDHVDQSYLQDHQVCLEQSMHTLTTLVKEVVAPRIQPLRDLVVSPLQLRKMHGPTRMHFDNVSPYAVGSEEDVGVATRVLTFILTLSDSEDEIVFPRQNRTIKLKKGSAVLFPPYWMYEHHTQSPEGAPVRYSLTTWLHEVTPLFSGESLPIKVSPVLNRKQFLKIPEVLQAIWWESAAPELLGQEQSRAGFDSFLRGLKTFLRARGIGASDQCVYDVLVRTPGSELTTLSSLTAVFNLGDEPVTVLVNEKETVLDSGSGIWTRDGAYLKPIVSGIDSEIILTVKSK